MQKAELIEGVTKVWVCDPGDLAVVEGIVISHEADGPRVWVKADARPAHRYFPADCRPTRDLAVLDGLEAARNALRHAAEAEREAHARKLLAGTRVLEYQAELTGAGDDVVGLVPDLGGEAGGA